MKPALARYFNKRGIPIPECEEAWRFGSIEMLRDQLDKEPDYSLEEVSFFCTGLRSVKFCWRNAYKTHHGEHWVQLIPDPVNEVDSTAVAVFLGPRHLGYLSSKIAREFFWRIQLLNGHGYRCEVPLILKIDESGYLLLPSIKGWREEVKIDQWVAHMSDIWNQLPEEIIASEATTWANRPAHQATKDALWELRDQFPAAYPATKEDDFPLGWELAFKPVRWDFKTRDFQRKLLEKKVKAEHSPVTPVVEKKKQLCLRHYERTSIEDLCQEFNYAESTVRSTLGQYKYLLYPYSVAMAERGLPTYDGPPTKDLKQLRAEELLFVFWKEGRFQYSIARQYAVSRDYLKQLVDKHYPGRCELTYRTEFNWRIGFKG